MTPRIVVGVDGSANSRLALRRAAEEAIAHAASLEVVPAWGCSTK
jgi:nucleotide-binding universal stress UspA family protein